LRVGGGDFLPGDAQQRGEIVQIGASSIGDQDAARRVIDARAQDQFAKSAGFQRLHDRVAFDVGREFGEARDKVGDARGQFGQTFGGGRGVLVAQFHQPLDLARADAFQRQVEGL
jgi:hypothetical protein